ncbi:MAG TPA: AraC family transcriptional regulator [Rhodocyclaceae bacterium]|nr:AraC family transcriptional regulator [Rhodocyclaceae bacterium]
MPLNFVSHRQQFCRVRHVIDYIGTHLDDEVKLDDLAEVAHLSSAHLVRFYSRMVGEAPMQTLRRLRLRRAFEQIGQGGFGRFTDVGVAAGYGSSAAFTHAFRKQFGLAPTDVPLLLPATERLQPLRLEFLPARKVFQFAYEGVYSQNGYYKARMMWLSHVAERPELLCWRVNDRDHPFSEGKQQRVQISHFIPVSDQTMWLDEADLVTHPAGLYVVVNVAPNARDALLAALAERVRDELGCEIVEGRTLDRDIHERACQAPQERRIEVYIPVAPRSPLGCHLATQAESAARRKS